MSKRLFIGCFVGLTLLPLNNSNSIQFNINPAQTDANLQQKCNNSSVEIFQSNSTIRIQGSCTQVEIFGWNNHIELENSKNLEIFGTHNQIQAKSIRNIEIFGSSNDVHTQSTQYVEILGANNTIVYQQPLDAHKAIQSENFGAQNVIKQNK